LGSLDRQSENAPEDPIDAGCSGAWPAAAPYCAPPERTIKLAAEGPRISLPWVVVFAPVVWAWPAGVGRGNRTDMRRALVVATLVTGVLAGCSGHPQSDLAAECERGLDAGFAELERAKARGLDGTVDWGKAAALLSAAKVQRQFEKYPNCIEKVGRARVYLKGSQ
jgi:hypothetical protein